ncbi:MucBP domain-containing protein [Streptococcus porcorum]|uniref:LPXTG-motif cell wall-anchored protein n=1 Tax=Streptococcus porcorum TaxID=701526 RepID=A0ABV2JHA2_9STRE
MFLPTTEIIEPEVTGFRIPSTKLSKDVSTYQTEKVDINGESYTVYKIPFVDGVTSVNETEAGVYVDYTMTQEYFYGSPTETKTTNVYYGLAFDSLSNFVRSGGEDALDLDGDQDLGDTAGETSIIGVSGTIKGISPKALFVYDQSKYTGGYSFDTTGVEAGDTVSIKASIQNNTVGTNYSDMTVITVLSNSQDEIFDGSKSRGSQFTPTLTGPITAPTGWTVYYTTDEQDSNESGANLTGWTDVVDDYSKVTAIKLVSDPGVVLKTGSMVSFEYGLTTPADARSGSSITTTTAIAVNGSTNFLEGYRSTVQIKKTYGSVLVAYVDINGNTIADTAIDSPDPTETWTPYDTADKRQSEITVGERVYRLVASGNYPVGTVGDDGNLISHADTSKTDGIEPTTGEVGVGAKTVTYVYQEVLGKVTVKYVDEDGNPISGLTEDNKTVADTVEDTPESSLGTPYTTTDHKPTTITTADGKLYRYKEIQTGSADETGTVTEGEKIVTYVYELVKGNVTVNYKTVDGTEISPSVSDERDTPVGQPYDTRDQIKETITTTDGKVYKRIPKAVEGAETGKVVEGTTEVTYYYELVKGDVIVNYETTDGTTLAPQVVDTNDGDTGSDYSTTDHKPEKIVVDTTGDVYYILPTGTELKTGSAPETGKVAPGVTEVTYLYQKAGHVKVNYVLDDASATVLKDSVMDVENGKPGATYSTSEDNKPLTITAADGKVYQLKEVQADSAAETGSVEAGKTLEVTYIYTEVLSDVIVEYYDTEGNVIATTVVDEDDKSVGTVYNTDEDNKPATITTDDGTVYYYKEVKDTSAPTTGKVSETTTTVQYVYEKAGNVVVNYIAEDGTVIASPVADETNVKPGYDYNTTDNKPTTITTEDGKTYELIPTATIGSETGTVEVGKTTEVTYVYKEVKGSVVVNYVTTDGTVIQDPVTDTPETSTGTAYDTRDVKPTEITTADGKSYRLVPTLTVGNETGTVVPGVTQVTYVYEEVKGDVVVNYINTDGDVIASQVVDTKTTSTGTAYDTTDNKPTKITTEDGTVYYYKEVEANSASETGKVVEGTTQVTYVYEKAGNVVVNYTLADGTVLKDPVNDETNQAPGYAYDTTDNKPDAITTTDGKVYRLVPSATIGNETGDVESDTTLEVTYIYEEVLSDVIVEYYDTEGNVIATTVVDEDDKSVGTVYNTDEDNKPATITTDDGTVYYYKEVKDTSAPTTGKVSETTTTVQYVYEKAGNVVVNYIAEDGTVIASPVADETNAQPGTSYDTTDHKPTTITTEDGKTYELIPTATIGSETGTVEAGKTTEVTYVYKEVKGSVVVNYVTTDGTVLQAPVTDTPETSTGTAYDTRDVKPTEITTADGKTYRLVPTLTVGNETGTVVPGVTQVTYIYEEVKGDVVVNYVNTAGDVIASQVVDTKTTSTGTTYDTTDNKPTKITTEDGTVYYYKEVEANSDSETGKVVEGTTQVTYVYEKAGNVVVNYITEDGTVIKQPVNDETNAQPGTEYNTTDNKPTTITTEDGTTYELVPSVTIGTENGEVESGKTTEVTYVYRKVETPAAKTGNVVVEYYNIAGEKIATDVVDTPETTTGTVYETFDFKPSTITKDGVTYFYKEVKDTSAAEKGTVVEGTTTVQYVYEPAGNIVVNYTLADGTVIKQPVNDETNAQPGTSYDTTDNKPETITTTDGKVYRLVPSATIGNETGDVESDTTLEVTYIYEEVKSDVVVEYYNTDGEVIATTVVDEDDTSVGTVYNTDEDNRPATITTEDGTVYYYKEVKDTSAPTTGKVAETTTTVQYVYEKAGNVVVNYIAEDGTVIKRPVNDETNAQPGTEYNTTDNKPTTITTEDGKTYELIPTATIGTENGEVESGKTTEVTYVYRKVETPAAKTGNVVVEYYNIAGEKIATDVVDTPETTTGTVYETFDFKPSTITKNGVTYFYKEVKDTSAAEKGTVVEGTTTVQYVYEPTGSVTVNYVTTDGTVIKSPIKDEENAEPGKTYSTEDNKPTTITTEDGKTYKLVPNLTTGEENGTVTSGEDKQITYVYEEVKGSVVVNYIDTEGKVIKAPVIDTPSSSTGTAYDTTDNKPTTITTEDGTTYELVPVLTKGSETGKVVEGETIVTYVYRKVVAPTPNVKTGSVVIRYVEAGNESNVLKDPVLDENAVVTGTKYDTTDEGDKPAEIVKDGVRYVLVPSKTTAVDPNGNPVNETGEVAEGTTVVIYKYQKVANWIPQIPVTPENPTPVNPVIPYPFDPTNPDKPLDPTTPYPGGEVPSIPHVLGFTPVDPKTNEPLKPVDPTDPSKGYVPPTPDESGIDTPIPYVQNGNVVVNYVTEDGTVIKSPVQDEINAPAGKSYDTTDNKPNTITTEDGTTYELVRVEGSETGTVEGGKTTEVTYVYRKVETPAKKVVTNYVDEAGNPIAPQEEGTTPNKSIPGYEFTGKTVTDEDGNTTHIYRKVTKVVTNHVDEAGNPIAPQEEGTTPNKGTSIPGYEFTGKTITDENGNTTHIYRKVVTPVDPTAPVTPEDPTDPVTPVTPVDPKAPVQPDVTVRSETPAKIAYAAETLPKTGEDNSAAVTAMGVSMILASLGLATKRRR